MKIRVSYQSPVGRPGVPVTVYGGEHECDEVVFGPCGELQLWRTDGEIPQRRRLLVAAWARDVWRSVVDLTGAGEEQVAEPASENPPRRKESRQTSAA